MNMTTDDQHIISIVRQDSEAGFRLLMAGYRESVYWHIRRLVVSHADAQDAVQDTFVRIFRSLGQLRQGHSLRGWIYRIATNEALRLISRRRVSSRPLDELWSETDSMAADTYIDYSDLIAVRMQRAILSLPSRQQLAFNLRYYDEMSYDEIAMVVGSTAAAAKSNYYLAKEKIVEYMKKTD